MPEDRPRTLEDEVRRLRAGIVRQPPSTRDPRESEMVRVVSAASLAWDGQFDRVDRFSRPLLPSATFTVHEGVLLVRWQGNRAGVVDTCSVLAADGTLLHLDPPRLASLDLPDDLIADIAALAVRRLPLEHARASDRYQLEQRSARMGFEELPECLRG